MDEHTKLARAREIQEAIGRILLEEWDPIGISDVPEAQDEYGGYVAGVYGLLASGASPQAIAEHLCGIERNSMGFTQALRHHLLPVAEKLCRLDVKIEQE